MQKEARCELWYSVTQEKNILEFKATTNADFSETDLVGYLFLMEFSQLTIV